MRTHTKARFASILATLALGAGILALPGSALAETALIGRADINSIPNQAEPFCESGGACAGTFAFTRTQSTSSSLGAAPAAGVITGWRVQGISGASTGVGWSLRILRPSGASLKAVGTSPPVGPGAANGSLNALAKPLPVQAGDLIGVTATDQENSELSIASEIQETPGGGYTFFEGAFPENSSSGFKEVKDEELFLNAEFTTDVPAGGAPPAPPVPPDTQKPKLSALSMSPPKFVAANSGPALLSAAVGTHVSYKLSEPAKTTLTVERGKPGFKKGKNCVAKKPSKSARSCTRYVKVKGSLTHEGVSGLNTFRFMGRIANKSLAPGRYRLNAVSADPAGNKSQQQRLSFQIVK